MKNKHIGTSFDDFLREEGIFEVVEEGARRIGLAIELRKVMRRKRVTEAELARRLRTSRTAIRRILDPTQRDISLDRLVRVAGALGCELEIKLAVSKPARRKSARANVKRAA